MSKSRCAENINLVKQACNKKTNLLVYEREKGDTCKQSKAYISPISCPQMKRIKVCTGKELKKICPPPPCPCPPKITSHTFFQKFAQLLGFGAKSAIALGAIFLTYDMGIWGDAESTGRIYERVCSFLLPKLIKPLGEKPISRSCEEEQTMFGRQKVDKFCCDKFPVDHEAGLYDVQQKWNKIVTATFSTIAEIPAEMKKMSHKLYCKFSDSESCKKIPTKDDPPTVCDLTK